MTASWYFWYGTIVGWGTVMLCWIFIAVFTCFWGERRFGGLSRWSTPPDLGSFAAKVVDSLEQEPSAWQVNLHGDYFWYNNTPAVQLVTFGNHTDVVL